MWAAQYAELLPLNGAEFEAIDKAMAVFVLEDTEPASQDEVLRQICGGDASNRWFDKVCELCAALSQWCVTDGA